jgi:hypothetical protein
VLQARPNMVPGELNDEILSRVDNR